MNPKPIGSRIGSIRYGTPQPASLLEAGLQRVERAAEIGNDDDARAGAGEVARHSMLEPFTLSTSSAPASTALRISSGSNVSTLTRIRRRPARERRRRASGTAGPGVQPMSMMSAPDARKVGLAAHRLARQARRVVDLGEDLDVPGAVLARRRSAAECRGISRRSFGPFSTPHQLLGQDPGVALAQAGDHHQVGT